jgi:N,N'-diacetylchitobiose transport system permease protein
LLPYGLLVPAGVVVLGTLVYPVGDLLVLSFQRENLSDLVRRTTTWVGAGNYASVLGDRVFWSVLPRTVVFAATCVGLTMLLGTGCALLMRRASRWARTLLSAGLVLAWATPVIIGAVVWKWLFDSEFGVVNAVATASGGCACRHHSWFLDQHSAFTVLVAIVVWGAVPFVALSLYGGLQAIPPELGEAARVDGASSWAVFRSITFPMLRPIYAILLVLSVIWDTKVFPQVWLTTRGGPDQSTVMLGVYVYVKGISDSRFGMASAIAVVLTVLLLGLSWFYIRTLRAETT